MPWSTMGRILVATLFMGVAVSAAIWAGAPWLLAAAIVGPSSYTAALFALRIPSRKELRELGSGSGGGQEPASQGEIAA